MSLEDQILTVAHEDCHSCFHASTVAFLELPDHRNTKEERQADMYSTVVLVDSLSEFDTIEQFIRVTPLTERLAILRAVYCQKYEPDLQVTDRLW